MCVNCHQRFRWRPDVGCTKYIDERKKCSGQSKREYQTNSQGTVWGSLVSRYKMSSLFQWPPGLGNHTLTMTNEIELVSLPSCCCFSLCSQTWWSFSGVGGEPFSACQFNKNITWPESSKKILQDSIDFCCRMLGGDCCFFEGRIRCRYPPNHFQISSLCETVFQRCFRGERSTGIMIPPGSTVENCLTMILCSPSRSFFQLGRSLAASESRPIFVRFPWRFLEIWSQILHLLKGWWCVMCSVSQQSM